MARRRARSRKRTPKRKVRARRKTHRTRKESRKQRKKRWAATRRAKRLRYEQREAKLAGLTHREYVHRRAVRERAHREKIDHLFATGGNGAVFRYLIEKGNLDTRDPGVLEAAGMSEAEAESHTTRHIQRDLAETKRRAALGDKQSQAVLSRFPQ